MLFTLGGITLRESRRITWKKYFCSTKWWGRRGWLNPPCPPPLSLRWWYCECKLFKSEKWCHLSKHDFPWQEPNPRSSKLLLLSSWLQFCVVTTCYTLLHQATRAEGKNSSRKHKDVLVLIVILSNFSLSYLSFNLWCAILLQVMLYSA